MATKCGLTAVRIREGQAVVDRGNIPTSRGINSGDAAVRTYPHPAQDKYSFQSLSRPSEQSHLLLRNTPYASSSSTLDTNGQLVVLCHPTILCVLIIGTEETLNERSRIFEIADPIVDGQC